jgi:hypothetical protein
MSGTLKTSIALSLAALMFGLAASTPVDAKPFPKMFPPHHFHHFHGGWGWGPGLALGLVGAAVAADVAATSCTGYRPIYDQSGAYLGQQAVNVCY